MELAKSLVHHEQSEHINVLYHFTREHVKVKNVLPYHIHIHVAEMFTKALSKTS